MTNTTANSMKMLEQKPEAMLQAKVSKELKQVATKGMKKLKMTESSFVRLAVVEKLIREGMITE